MKLKGLLTVMAIALLVIPTYSGASTVFETTGWIKGWDGLIFDFEADVAPFTYKATIADLSPPPSFGLSPLFLVIASSSEFLGFRSGEGSISFSVEEGKTYFAGVFGKGSGELDAGLFGLKIESVPIPTTLMLFGSALFGLIFLRRRRH